MSRAILVLIGMVIMVTGATVVDSQARTQASAWAIEQLRSPNPIGDAPVLAKHMAETYQSTGAITGIGSRAVAASETIQNATTPGAGLMATIKYQPEALLAFAGFGLVPLLAGIVKPKSEKANKASRPEIEVTPPNRG